MKHKFKKNLNVVNNLISYCHELGCTEYLVDIRLYPDSAVFEIQCPIAEISEAELRYISETLGEPRQHEVEQNYWGLSGEFDPQSDLQLTGMMVDEAEVRYEHGRLYITAKRLEN